MVEVPRRNNLTVFVKQCRSIMRRMSNKKTFFQTNSHSNMAAVDNGDTEIENNKHSFYSRMIEDGKLVSPIDLCLETAEHLKLDMLKWMNIDVPPVRMKLTNTGETVIVSAKWATERPYLTGGPLKDSYVFSQIHFHWGSDEREGSEHTVRGICYPMEMHVVFYKTRYLTQEAALKQDDGVIIVVYLIKLANKTTAGVHWLVSQLDRVVQPHSSTPLPLSPLSALLVPFLRDYLVYWGSLQTARCAHTMLWLVSRAALAITVDDTFPLRQCTTNYTTFRQAQETPAVIKLKAFRNLLNARKEAMSKNFRISNDPMGRVVYHVNPSKETKNLLLPGTADPPGQVMVVSYYQQMPALSNDQAKQIFCKGDSVFHSEKLSTNSASSDKPEKKVAPSLYKCNEIDRVKTMAQVKQSAAFSNSGKGSSLKTDYSSSTNGSPLMISRALTLKQAQQSKQNKIGTTSNESFKCRESGIIKAERIGQKIGNFPENVKNKGSGGVRPEIKSRLPVSKLQSSLKQTLQKPVSEPLEKKRKPLKTTPRPLPEMKRAPAVTTIPRPIGRNAGKLYGCSAVKADPPYNQIVKTRPTSSPNQPHPRKPQTLI